MKSEIDDLYSEIKRIKDETHQLRSEAREKSSLEFKSVRTRTNDSELTMIERELEQSLHIQRILNEDIQLFQTKLEVQKKTQEDQAEKVAQIESQAKVYGLTNPKIVDMFDKLSDLGCRLQGDIKTLSKSIASKCKLREEKIHMIRLLIDSKSREIAMIEDEDNAIIRSIASMQQAESNRELQYIEMIAKKEKQKIAAITGSRGLLLEGTDYLNMQDNEGIGYFADKKSTADIKGTIVSKINQESKPVNNSESLAELKW